MRSFLFVPGDSQRKFENAKKTAADALILDLEDSIAPDEKVGARRTVREMLDARNPGQKYYIRVNALDTGMTLGDLAAVMPGPARRDRAAEMRRRRRRQPSVAVSRRLRGGRRD
jgi:citrate lyase subunit beta/citryl-CoA lyase